MPDMEAMMAAIEQAKAALDQIEAEMAKEHGEEMPEETPPSMPPEEGAPPMPMGR